MGIMSSVLVSRQDEGTPRHVRVQDALRARIAALVNVSFLGSAAKSTSAMLLGLAWNFEICIVKQADGNRGSAVLSGKVG
jgi:hypothetical protein